MFFREKATKNGTLLQLVRGHRGLDGKVRQQVVLSLGGCQIPDCYWRELAHHVENAILGQEELLEIRPEVAK